LAHYGVGRAQQHNATFERARGCPAVDAQQRANGVKEHTLSHIRIDLVCQLRALLCGCRAVDRFHVDQRTLRGAWIVAHILTEGATKLRDNFVADVGGVRHDHALRVDILVRVSH